MIRLALLALCLASPALACERLSQHFDLCSEGTPWADGVWEQGGDSATLHLGDISFDGFEGYWVRDQAKTIGAELDAALTSWEDRAAITHHQRDALKSPDLSIVRSIDTMIFPDTKPALRVTMIAVSHQHRILMLLKAPATTDIALLDQMSRDIAGLVRPHTEVE